MVSLRFSWPLEAFDGEHSRQGPLPRAKPRTSLPHVGYHGVYVAVSSAPAMFASGVDPVRRRVTVVYADPEAVHVGADPRPASQKVASTGDGGVAGGGLVEDLVRGEDEPAWVGGSWYAKADGHTWRGEQCAGVVEIV
ncbi:uncharacterized protein B0H18DRAFT_996157 [Fomitopsis serialis]|uniref:uncharacterized protein n=1 Tax=Fomitopsis serialis TaxID=139415 RepID=UPI0020072277|nr:uncharacterized protein B0H18DRAFT_996157 [Neoantrodia serialis]KAH9929767.1 hypothetical protein B0H18DRAFT_996157 [Neoantrodia serialis]